MTVTSARRARGHSRKQFRYLEALEIRTLLTALIGLGGNGQGITAGSTSPAVSNFTEFGLMSTTVSGDIGSETRTFTIFNTGDAALNLTQAPQITGDASGDFTVTVNPTTTIAAGTQSDFTITFVPQAAGLRQATVTVSSDDPNFPAFTFAIEGTGVLTTNGTDGLETATITAGTGNGAVSGAVLAVNYTGTLMDGTVFDSSLNPGRSPFQLTLGAGQVIPGWDEGLVGIQAGETRLLVIPASLAYGSSGNGSIPPNTPLMFTVSALDVQNPGPVVSDVSKFILSNTGIAFQASDFSSGFTDTASGYNNNPQVIEIVSLPAQGTLTFNGNSVSAGATIPIAQISSLSYQSNSGYTGADSFSWTASDGTDFAATSASVNLTVSATPVASDVNKNGNHNTTLNFTASDFTSAFLDADSQSLQQIEIVTLPANGTLELNGQPVTAGQLINLSAIDGTSAGLSYAPNLNYSGTDTFAWNGSDGTNPASSTASVNINVQESPPTLSDVTKTVAKNISTAFAAADFTAGFTDLDPGDALQSIQILSLPTSGTLEFIATTGAAPTAVTVGQAISVSQIPDLIYVAPNGFLGTDSFTWTASDGSEFAAAGATMTVTVADTPPALSTITLADKQNTKLTLTLANFKSAFADADAGDSLVQVAITQLPTYGTLSLAGLAVYTYQVIPASQLGKLTYTPNKNFAGTESMGWSGSDGADYAANPASLNINVSGMAPTVGPISKGVLENSTSMAFSAWDFTNAFTEPNVSPILESITVSSLPAHGTLILNGTAVSAGQVIAADQIAYLSYQPNTGYFGSDAFNWKGSDGINTSASAATVTLTVVSSSVLSVSSTGGVIPTGSTTTSIVNLTNFGQIGVIGNLDGNVVTRTFTITNNSGATINFTGGANLIQFTGANAGDFTASGFTDTLFDTAVTSLVAGESATFTITFTPKAIGSRTATVKIPVSSGAAYTFAVAGTSLNTFNNNDTTSSLYGLQYATLQAGTGTGAGEGDILTMNYTGYLLDGTLFDSSLNPDRTPFQFELGGQQVITGWDPGLIGIKVGETRTLIIPSSLGYGTSGSGSIPANATLVFIVQCLGIGVPRVGAGVANNANYITPQSTAASIVEGTDFGLLTATQNSMTVSFSLYSLGYGYYDSSQGQTVTAGLFFSYNDSSTNYTDNAQVVLSGIDTTDFSLAHSANTGTFTVTFNRPYDGNTALHTAVVSVYTNDAVNPAFYFTVQAGAAPFNDLSAVIGATHFPATPITSGSRTVLTFPLIVYNGGNTYTSGTTDIKIFAYNTATQTQTLLTTLSKQNLGGIFGFSNSRTLTLSTALPVGLPSGTYQLVAQVNPSGTMAESNYLNNFATSAQTFTVNQGLADLTGALVSTTTPVTIVSNTTINSSVTVSVSNQGNVLLPANQQVTIQIRAHNTDTNADTVLATTGVLGVNSLAAGGVSKFTVPVKYNAGLPAGHYILEAQVNPVQALAESSTANNLITQTALGQPLTVLATSPFYDLVPTLGTTHLPTATITSGDRTTLSVPVTIKNWGNVTSAGSTDIQIFALNTSTQAQTVITTLTNQNVGGLSANGGSSKSMTINTTLPIGFAAGTYELGVTVNPSHGVTESNYANDTAATTQTITVIQGLANLTGAVVSDTLPPAIVANASINASMVVQVANLGNVLLPANEQITIQVLAHDTVSSQNTVLTTSSLLSVASLKAGGISKFTIPVKNAGLAAGSYILEAQINPVQAVAESSTADNLITANTSGQAIALLSASGFNNLAGNLGSSTLPTTKVHGTALSGKVNVVVSNLGNLVVPAGQQITIDLVAYTAGGDVELKTSTFTVAGLAAGASKTFGLSVSVPGGMTAGSYTLQATIAPVQALVESSTADNVIALNGVGAAIPLTIT